MSQFSSLQRINQGLLVLATGLRPVVAQAMEAVHGAGWRQYASTARGSDPDADLDAYALLKTMLDNWQTVFRMGLKPADRTNVSLALTARNEAAHATGDVPAADAVSYLNAFQYVAKAVGAKAALPGLEALLKDQLDSLGSAAPAAAPPAKVEAPVALPPATLDLGDTGSDRYKWKPWREVAPPHADVTSARFVEAEFAADLSTVSRGQAHPTYQDPREFFRITYLTGGLCSVLQGAIRRLSAQGGDPVVGLQTAFGGGKTHTMLALYHLASAPDARALQGVARLLDDEGVDTLRLKTPPIVFVGTAKGPDLPLHSEGGRAVHTLWGYIAWRLAGWDGYERVRAADEARTNPGSEVLVDLLRLGAPCLILLDEVVAYARQLSGVQFDAFLTFFQSLTEAAKAVPGALVVGSLPESAIEAGGEQGAAALDRLTKIFGRVQSAWAAAQGNETYEIIRRRLFEPLDEDAERAREQAVKAYLSYYRANPGEFPAEARERAFEDAMRASWPVHPELFRILQTDWGALPKFQRTRGVLKMMAQVVFRLWRDGSDTPMIMPGYVPLGDDKVRVNVLEPLEPQYAAVIDREVAGDLSRPAAIEARSPNLSSKRAATRAATALFMATAPHGARNPGVEMARLRLGCAVPGDQPSLFGDAVRRMQESSAFLYAEGDRYWFSTQVTLNQEADNRGQALTEDAIESEITAMLRAEADVRVMGGWHRVYADADNSIEDAHETALVILRPAALHMARSDGQTAAMVDAADILERRGAGQRQFRNRLVFLAPDLTAITDLRTNVRRKLAWQSIVNDAAGSLQLTPVQASDAANKLAEARTAAERALRNCWKHLLWPVTPDNNDSADAARGFTITGVTLANRANAPLPQAAWDKARPDGVVAERLGAAILVADLQKVWPAGENHLSIRRLRDWYAQFPYMTRLRDSVVLADAIQALVGRIGASHAYAAGPAGAEGFPGLSLDKPVTVSLDSDAVLVIRTAAAAQLDRRADDTQQAGGGADTSGGIDGSNTTGDFPQPPTAEVRRATRFHATVELDASRPGPMVSQIAQAILAELARGPGARVRVRLDIEAEDAAGFTPDVIEIINDNARTLKIDSFAFEKD